MPNMPATSSAWITFAAATSRERKMRSGTSGVRARASRAMNSASSSAEAAAPASAPVEPQPWRATDSGSTANPWFWAVISTLSVTRSFTGWFAPWWPNLSLYVRPPPANPMIW